MAGRRRENKMRSTLGLLGLLLLGGCVATPIAIGYKNGVEFIPGALQLDQRPSFRFVERWHISFAWLSGQWGANECNFGHNPFRGKVEYGPVAFDNNAPQWQWRSAIVRPYISDKKPFAGKLHIALSGSPDTPSDIRTLGHKQTSGKVSYTSYCSASLSESFTSASVKIINAKLHEDAESLVRGAKAMQIGSNQWRMIEHPLSDYPDKRYGNRPLLEQWVLEIPQTDYWMVFTFYASKQFSYTERREAYERAHDLFRQAVSSVSLTPITPFVDQEKIIEPAQCVRPYPTWPWMCPINEKSWMKR